MREGHNRSSATDLGMKLEKLDMEEKGESKDLRLACLLLWQPWLVGSQGVCPEVGGWDKSRSREKKVWGGGRSV